jgi:hypothetical protein
MVCAMEESEVIATIVAGDPAGLAEALDTYATSLYAYCRSILPPAGAADVVTDTFIVARAKLDGLRDPARLSQWLQAVARNECFRRVIADGGTPPADPVTPVPGVDLPDGLDGRIMALCTDDTPAGRAYRATVTHRSGQFGYDGFPRPVAVARPRRVPRIAAVGGAVLGAAAVIAVLIVALSGGSRPTPVVTGLSSPAGVVGVSSPATDTAPGPAASPARSGKHKVTLTATHSPAPTAPAGVSPGNPAPAPSAAGSQPPAASPPAVKPPTAAPPPPQPTPSPSTSTDPPPPDPVILVSPAVLSLTSVNGAAVSGSISVLGYGGSVTWSAGVSTGGGHIAVSPAAGALKPGASTVIRVTASGTVSFTAHITLMPGDHVVTVEVTAKKVVTKKVITARPS